MYTTGAFEYATEARRTLESSMQDAAKRDRDIVLASIEEGKPVEDLLAQFCSDEHFESWYQETLKLLEAYK